MAGYRDPLEAARRRIESLEANLAERDAALAAREGELRELNARLERRGRSSPFASSQATWGFSLAVGLLSAASLYAISSAQQQKRLAQVSAELARDAARLCEARAAESPPALFDVAPRVPPALSPPAEAPPLTPIMFDAPAAPSPRLAGPAFDRSAALRALNEASERARRECRRGDAPDPIVKATITFHSYGKVLSATFDSPLDDTAAGRCVLVALRRAAVPPFQGRPVAITKWFAWEK